MEGFHDVAPAVHRLARRLPRIAYRARCPAGPALAQWLGKYVREGNRDLVAAHLRVIAAAGAGADLDAKDVVALFPRTKTEGLAFGLGTVARQYLHGAPDPVPSVRRCGALDERRVPGQEPSTRRAGLHPCPELWVNVLYRWSVEILDAPELRPIAEELTGQGARDATESEEETIRALVNEADVDTAFCRNGARAFRVLRPLATMTSGVGVIVVDETLRRARSWDIPELSAVEPSRGPAPPSSGRSIM